MDSPDVVLELRPPPLASALYGASLVMAVVLVVAFALTAAGGPPFVTAVFVAFVVGICGFNTATVRSHVRARTDGSLEVRNRLSIHRLQRSDVDRVILGRRAGFGSLMRLELLLQDGTTLQLIATETPPLPRLRRRLERQADELRRWLNGSPSPSR